MRSSSRISQFELMLHLVAVVLCLCDKTLAQTMGEALQIIEQAVEDGSIPGASALIMRHGKVIEERSFGVCEIDPKRPFLPDTVCWIASITKPITAAAAMKLVEDGKLDLDSPIESYLPSLSQFAPQDGSKQSITVRQLMSHSSGIPASVPLRPRYFFTQEWFSRDLSKVVEAIAKRPVDFEPGTQVHYSNAAPYVLARIIEVQSGRRFEKYVRTEILEPLQMTDTSFAVPAKRLDRTAVVYRREGKELSVYCRYDPDWKIHMAMPDGGLFSTPRDIARFASAFLNGAVGMLDQESVNEMLSKQNDSYGLGWIMDKPHQFSHWGSSGTLVWADRRTEVVGVFFSQIQDFGLLAELRERFRNAVDKALGSSR